MSNTIYDVFVSFPTTKTTEAKQRNLYKIIYMLGCPSSQ